jgi:hypothetical protein
MESAKNWVDLKQGAELVVRTSSGHADQPDQRHECLQPMATLEKKLSIKLQETILHVTSLGYQLRKTIDASHKNVSRSRQLVKETKVIFEESRSLLLSSQRLRQASSAQ